MKHRTQILALSLLTALALVGFFPAGSAWGQEPISIGIHLPKGQLFTVSPFFVDATNQMSMLITNTGESGDLCADLYLFTPDGKMIACCACPVKQNGLTELSINDLTKNPVTGVLPTKGVIKAVPSFDCYPQYPNLAAGMKTYQIIRSNTQAVTSPPIPVPDAPLGIFELMTLERQCTAIHASGNGQGICSCGTGQ